jgi:hypothetical protein
VFSWKGDLGFLLMNSPQHAADNYPYDHHLVRLNLSDHNIVGSTILVFASSNHHYQQHYLTIQLT